MILQYKGLNGSWFYESAERIGYARLNGIRQIIEGVKNKGWKADDELLMSKALFEAVNSYIETTTGANRLAYGYMEG